MSEPKTAKSGKAKIRLVVGLGNPGKEYQNTRHNVGFDIVDFLANQSAGAWSTEKKWQAAVAKLGDVFLLKPLTYMNLSGRAVSAICRFHKIEPAEVLAVYDDLALESGRLRLRASGSAAGHNGIKSIIQSLGTQEFSRLKFGIGRKVDVPSNAGKGGIAGDLSSYVLGKFSTAEREELEKVVARAADAVNCALSQGLTAAMNAYNEQPEKVPKKKKTQLEVKAEESDKG